jgi:hypothetical protein
MTRYRLHGAAREGPFLQRHSLSLVLAAILVAQTIAAMFAGYHVWSGEQEVHGAPLDTGEFWIWWFWEYNISLVADTFGVILIVLLSKRLEEAGSAESKHDQTEEDEDDGGDGGHEDAAEEQDDAADAEGEREDDAPGRSRSIGASP